MTATTAPTAPDRAERLRWGAAVAVIVVIGFVAVYLHDSRYFYVDDSESGAVGNWLELGRLLRSGQFVPLVLDRWMAGNYPVEGQGGLWNPVQMAINFIAPSIDNLALLAASVKIGFAVVLAWGVYRVAMVYGARPSWAAVAATSAPFAGFTLFFEQPSWVTSLIGMAWVVQAWASGVRYVRGTSGPIPVFVFLYLAISVGYVHAALMSGVVVGCVIIGEFVHNRNVRGILRLGAVGIAAALCGAVTFLPGFLTSGVTWRTGEGTLNDNFLTAPWSETITASIPSSVTSIESWTGETTLAPATYIAWFVVPIVAFVAWRAAMSSLRELSGPLLILAFLLLFTAGPSDIGPVRWPARLLSFVAVVVLILVSVLVSRYGTTRPIRPRLLTAGLIVAVLVIRAWSSGPQYLGRHLLSALFVGIAGLALLYLFTHVNLRRFAAPVLMVLVVPIALYQVTSFAPVLNKWYLPTSQSQAREQFPDFTGTTLQLGSRMLTDASGPNSPDLPWRSQVYGNYAKDLNLDYVNAYTPVGHQSFSGLLCMEFDGSTCDSALTNVFRLDAYTGRTFADLMLLDRVVVQKAQYPSLQNFPVPPGWTWVQVPEPAADKIAALERVDGPISGQAGRVSATVDATATSISSSAKSEEVQVSSPNGGSVIFARLAWPGYTATLDGQDLQTKGLGGTFLYVDLPPGTTDADLQITFRPPGQRLGLAAMGLGLLIVIAAVVEDIRRRRKLSDDDSAQDPPDQPDQSAGGRSDAPVVPTTTVSL